MKSIIFPLLFILCSSTALGSVSWNRGRNLTVVFDKSEAPVVHTALGIFTGDYRRVLWAEVTTAIEGNPVLYIGTVGLGSTAEWLAGRESVAGIRPLTEGFLIVEKDGDLVVLGSDKRGTAYGILELSRMIGVSPWEWWADSAVEPRERIYIPDGFRKQQSPSVKYRGIFLNDEDWGLTPWSYKTHEPSEIEGQVGPQTHARIFELLLRLRANTFWPAMHACSVPFYLTPGNRETADKYGIIVGTSHCEPMARNTNGEWKIAGQGQYDYVNNRENVLRFWEERVAELAGSDNIYTLGIRGVHDGKMEGAKTWQEQKEALTGILKDQREMLARHIDPDVESVPQVFIPYKEVLDVYNRGLEVPGDVTLMWCDDNYGYIRHFPDSAERTRKGGNGVYYHISYWGRPHDYLWLATTHPAQICTQMKTAYDKGAQEMWIVNVGDIKPAEYLIELFLDMAWNIDATESNREGPDRHLHDWLAREFGNEMAETLTGILNEYYRLAYIRKPEFLGNTRTEEKDPAWKEVSDLPWSEAEIRRRIEDYQAIESEVVRLSGSIPAARREAWFQLVEYPVRGAAQMNYKHLYGQLARHGLADWRRSDAAYDEIVALTERYNTLGNGKWRYMMDYRPRQLAVFERVPHTVAETPLKPDTMPDYLFNGIEFDRFSGTMPVANGLGYQRGAVALPVGTAVEYDFKATDPVRVEIALAPNHPVEGQKLCLAIRLDDGEPQIIEYQTSGRSEEWKENVLRNQAVRTIEFTSLLSGSHRLGITAIDEGVVIDQIKIRK